MTDIGDLQSGNINWLLFFVCGTAGFVFAVALYKTTLLMPRAIAVLYTVILLIVCIRFYFQFSFLP